MTGTRLRLNEVYLSIQGEGPRVGKRTIFTRFAGCNLRCSGWACDTPHAIDPKLYRQDSKLLDPANISSMVLAAAGEKTKTNICYTGGEPFLQNTDGLQELSHILSEAGLVTQEVFTNGTIKFPEWAFDSLYFILDYKLSGAGEEVNIWGTEGVQRNRLDNIERLHEGDVVKFTIADHRDYQEAKLAYEQLQQLNSAVGFIYGVVWGKLEAATLIEWALQDKLPWTYSHQLHNVIWDRTQRGI